MATAQRKDAKRPISIVAGPYGHPIHPLLVTLPIGAWVASLIFDVVSRTADQPAVFAEGAYWLIAVGVIGALLAAMFGFMDLLTIPRGTSAFRTGLTHMTLNLTVTAVFVVSFLVRLNIGRDQPTPIWLIVVSAVALAALSVSGWLGGKMTYRYGVRVAVEEDQAEGYRSRLEQPEEMRDVFER